MAFDRAAAKAAGYSDEEIDAYLQSQPATVQAPAPVQQAEAEPGEPPAPTTVIPEVGSTSGNITEAATLGGMAVAPYVLPAAGAAAAAYGGSKLYGAWNASAQAAQALADAKMASEAGIAERAAAKAAGRIPGPVAPQAAPGTSAILDSSGRPMVRQPIAPQPAPAAQAAEQSMASRVRQAAAQRIAGLSESAGNMLGRAAPYAARAAGVAGAALMPGNAGQNYNFPTTGPLRGSEINPRTGRPWTGQELAAYKQQYGG